MKKLLVTLFIVASIQPVFGMDPDDDQSRSRKRAHSNGFIMPPKNARRRLDLGPDNETNVNSYYMSFGSLVTRHAAQVHHFVPVADDNAEDFDSTPLADRHG